MKKRLNKIILFLLALCLLLCCCSCAKEPQPVSLSKGEIELQTEQITTFSDAALEYDDPFVAAIIATQTQEMAESPDPSDDITALRVSFPQRDLPMDIYLGSHLYVNNPVLEIYYGYCSDGVWHDYPAKNYKVKSLTRLLLSSESVEAMDNDHVVQIGPYLLIGIARYYGNSQSYQVEDSLNSTVLSFEYNDSQMAKKELTYLYFEKDPNSKGESRFWCLPVDKYYYIAVEYDTLPKDYTITCIAEWANGSSTDTYTYDDIMSALEHEQ